MTQVDGLDTRYNFPDYIGRRPAMALLACKQLGDFLQHCQDNDIELDAPVPPFAVLIWIDMAQMLKELCTEGVVFKVPVPPEVEKWLH